MNEIDKKQSQKNMVLILRAVINIYNRAKFYYVIVLIIAVVFPIIGGLAALSYPEMKPFVAIFALSFGIIDIVFIDRSHKARMKTAAKLQEDFDCHVLCLEWNKFLVGNKVDPEEVVREASRKLSAFDEKRLIGWYPTIAGELPIHLARIICQRTNLWYDKELRARYKNFMLCSILCFFMILASYSLRVDFTLTSFVLTVLAPAAPALNWALREYHRQADTMKTLENLKNEIEKLWDKALSNATVEEVTKCSRELQDAIYVHRTSNPLIFNWVYNLLRKGLESNMNSGAEYWVKQAKTAKAIN